MKNPGSKQPNQGKPLGTHTTASKRTGSNPGGAPSGSTPGAGKAWTNGYRTKPQGGSGTERNTPKPF